MVKIVPISTERRQPPSDGEFPSLVTDNATNTTAAEMVVKLDDPAAINEGTRTSGARFMHEPKGQSMLGGLTAPPGRTVSNPIVARELTVDAKRSNMSSGAGQIDNSRPIVASERVDKTAVVDDVRNVSSTKVKSIEETRQAQKSLWTKIFDGIGKFLGGIANVLTKLADLLVDGVSYAVSGLAWLLASPALLFGVKPERLWEGVRSVVRPAFETISGLAQGALRLPFEAAMIPINFVRNVFTFKWLTSGKEAIALLTQPIIATGLAAVSPLFYGLKGLSDGLNPPRELTEREKASMRGYFPDDVIDRVKVVTGKSLIASIFMPAGMAAFTIGDDIYVASDGGHSLSGSTLRHESIHTLQYREAGGVVGFLGRYYAEFFGNWTTNGFDFYNAYSDISTENEAYGLQNG